MYTWDIIFKPFSVKTKVEFPTLIYLVWINVRIIGVSTWAVASMENCWPHYKANRMGEEANKKSGGKQRCIYAHIVTGYRLVSVLHSSTVTVIVPWLVQWGKHARHLLLSLIWTSQAIIMNMQLEYTIIAVLLVAI